ncbi:hypothetical protein L218DRAFT_400424 [Marasmius fiardii PR-910]|nr:hypothetical protein L218DRAFT_400424 [Marasmius fiardii PR-910]
MRTWFDRLISWVFRSVFIAIISCAVCRPQSLYLRLLMVTIHAESGMPSRSQHTQAGRARKSSRPRNCGLYDSRRYSYMG